MKAEANGTRPLEYRQLDRGDLIYGTKEQLQALGLGVGMAYPGETGGPKLRMRVLDPRGYKASIDERDGRDGRFCVFLTFPNWPDRPEAPMLDVRFPGVQSRAEVWFDEHVGSAEDLVAAGLARLDQLPGQPGMRKMRVTIFPDGTVPQGAPTSNCRQAREPGARIIERASGSCFRIRVVVRPEEERRRGEASKRAEAEWERRVRAMVRPARLCDFMRPKPVRGHLRLVWSAGG